MAQSYELNLRDYLRILKKRYRIIVALTVLCGVATFVLSPRQEPRYEADATLKLVHQSTVASLFLDSFTWQFGDDLATQSQIIASLPMALKVGQKMGRFAPDLTSQALAGSERLSEDVAEFQALYKAQPVSGTSLIRITARATDPDFSVRLVNTVADVFIEVHTYERNRQIIESRRFIEEQLGKYKRRLRDSESVLTAFKQSHLSSLSFSENEMARLNERLETHNRRIRALHTLIENLAARLVSPEATYVDLISGGFEDPAVEELNDELVRLQLQRERLLVVQQEGSPEVEALELLLRGLATRLLTAYRKTVEHLEVERDDLAAKFAALPENDAQTVRLAREVRVNEDTYMLLNQRYQEALIKEAEKIQEVSVVEYAAEARVDAVPGRLLRLLAGLVVGAMLGLLAAFLSETLDTSLGTIEEVEEYLDVPVVGIVPHLDLPSAMSALARSQPALAADVHLRQYASVVCRHDKRSPVAEAYRALRTNLEFARLSHSPDAKGGSCQVFLFTSASAGEGKSTTVVNLAVVMAQMGKRVLLLDCDLRNPNVNKFFGIDRAPGFTDTLLGSVSIDDAIRSSTGASEHGDELFAGLASEGLDSLNLLTSGTLPPHPVEILASSRFDQMLAHLRERFDVILIDSPPMLPVTDATVLGTKVDGVVITHRLGRISRNALRRSKTLLDNVGATIWGVVLNDLRANVTGYPDTYYSDGDAPKSPELASVAAAGPLRRGFSWLESLHPLLGGKSSGNDKNLERDHAEPRLPG